MVIAYHITLGAYGFWLPNDPRGSGSDLVWAEHLKPFGEATKADSRGRSLAGRRHDHEKRLTAKAALKYPAVQFTGVQARAIGRGFMEIGQKLGVTFHACSILPDHAHLVTARHRLAVEELAGILKRAATRQLTRENLHPLEAFRRSNGRAPCPWGIKGWYVYLNTPADVLRTIQYVEQNPEKAGLPRQSWSFVARFED